MHVSVQICICTCGGLRKLLNVFLYSLCLIGLEQSLTHQTMTNQRTPSILLSLPPKAGGAAHKSKLGFIPVLSIRTQPPAPMVVTLTCTSHPVRKRGAGTSVCNSPLTILPSVLTPDRDRTFKELHVTSYTAGCQGLDGHSH